MKKFLFIFAPAMLMAGCSEELVITPPEIEEEVTSEIPLRNVENAVYNELIGLWMIPQKDPFTLENFQQAYDNLASGKSLQILTRAETEAFSEPEQLEPTHYALRIYPKTEEEQWRVEMMEDVSVVYAPFDYSGLAEEDVERVPPVCSEIPSPFEVSPYTVTYDYPELSDGDPIGHVTYQLPILYVVWPVSKPLPDNLEYKIDYDIFLPHEAHQTTLTRSAESMQLLVNEAFALASDNPVEYIAAIKAYAEANENLPTTRADDGTVLEWKVVTPDSKVGRNVPMANLKVTYQHSSLIINPINSATDLNGMCKIPLPFYLIVPTLMYLEATVTYTYQDPKGRWKIVPDPFNDSDLATTIPFSVTINNWEYYDDNLFSPANPTVVLLDNGRYVNQTHRAVEYLYNKQTFFPKPAIQIGIAVFDISGTPQGGGNSVFLYNSSMETTFHELSHVLPRPILSSSLNSNHRKFFIESFAEFGGWYLEKEYYKSLGWTEPAGHTNKQSWSKSSYDYYTPFFIDLHDDYNQSTVNANRPNDQMKGVPASVIFDLYRTSSDWSQLKSNLQKYVGTGSGKYFTQTQLNVYLDYIDEWFENTKHLL